MALFLAVKLSSGLSATVFAAMSISGPFGVGSSVVAIKAGHIEGLWRTSSRPNACMRPRSPCLSTCLQCPMLGQGIGCIREDDVHFAIFIFKTWSNSRPMIIFPLGVPLDKWWLQLAGHLGEDERGVVLHQVAMALCRGIQSFHADGVVHLDVKPSNIIMMPEQDDTFDVPLDTEMLAARDDSVSGWRVLLNDFGGASTPESMCESSPLPPQRRFGGPRRKLLAARAEAADAGTGARPVDDLESLCLTLLSLHEPGAEERWRVSDCNSIEDANTDGLATSRELWNMEEMLHCAWYQELRCTAMSARDKQGEALYPEAVEVIEGCVVEKGGVCRWAYVVWVVLGAIAAVFAALALGSR